MVILRKWQIWKKFISGLAKIKTRWQKRHVDNCGLYENDIFCETYRRIWQGLRQWDNKTVTLTVGDFHKNGKCGKMGNWARIHPRSGKTSNEVTKRGILTKDKFRQTWWACQKFIKGLAKYSNEMIKRGMSIFRTMTNFATMANLVRSYQRFDKNLQRL